LFVHLLLVVLRHVIEIDKFAPAVAAALCTGIGHATAKGFVLSLGILRDSRGKLIVQSTQMKRTSPLRQSVAAPFWTGRRVVGSPTMVVLATSWPSDPWNDRMAR
jgi:hypothetical protein